MKVLFIGGTGIISSACSRLAVERGIDLYLLNRGKTLRPVPPRVNSRFFGDHPLFAGRAGNNGLV